MTPDPIEELRRSADGNTYFSGWHETINNALEAYDAKCAEVERLKGLEQTVIDQRWFLVRIREENARLITALETERAKVEQCKKALDAWRGYFQSENDPDLDPECHGEEFHACWDLMQEALSDTPPTIEQKRGES